LTRRGSARRAWGLGLAFGVGFFGLLLVWISIIGWIAWTVLVVVEAIFAGIFAAGWAVASRHTRAAVRVVLAAALWVALEYLRSIVPLGGFTWGELAQSQHNLGWMLRAASIGGGWTIAFLLVVVNALVAEAWVARATIRRSVVFCGIAAALIGLPLLLPGNSATGRPVRVAIVQGDVPRDFTGSVYDEELHIIDSHRRLTERLARTRPGIVVWPESAVGADPRHDPAASHAIATAARAAGAPMIVGANLEAGASHYKVVALDVSPSGAIVDVYQKTHLVPFGEYVPARRWLGWIPLLDQVPTDAVPGRAPTLFKMAGGVVAPVVSFEGDFGSLVRQRVALGGRLVVVATNTSTWGRSWASAQHVASSQVRAAEDGVWVVHASLSGISAFIAPDGRIVGTIPLWTRQPS
jgi:apolipoprotein N-acyltransferase